MAFCDISNVFIELRHLFQWTANNLHSQRSSKNEFVTEANVQAKFQIISNLISNAQIIHV